MLKTRPWLSDKASTIVDLCEAKVGAEAMRNGPGHNVFDSESVGDEHVNRAIDHCEDFASRYNPRNFMWHSTRTATEVETIRRCLIELLQMPEMDRWDNDWRIHSLQQYLEDGEYTPEDAEKIRFEIDMRVQRRRMA